MYRELMYGEATETLQASNSDSEVVINKPVSRVNTPAHYDSSSEDSMLNERIAKRREQMGVFEKEKVCKKFFISSDSDSSVAMASTKPKQKKRKTSENTSRTTRSSCHVKIGTRARLASSTTAGAPQQKKQRNKTTLQRLAKLPTRRKPPQVSTSPFTVAPTPAKGGPKYKKKARTALQILQEIDAVCDKNPKKKVGRPRKGKRGGNKFRKNVELQNKHLEERFNDPPLALREAVPDTHPGEYSDEEDPLASNLRMLDVEFQNGLDSPLTWIYGDCHSPQIPTVDRTPFTPTYTPGVNIPNLKSLSAAEVMEKFHPNSLYHRFAEESNGYFYRWHHGLADFDDVEEAELYHVPLYDLTWKDRTIGSIVQQYGLQLAQARRPRARMSDYWSTETIGPLTPDNYSDFCSRNRFNLHQRFFYINAAQPEDYGDMGVLLDKFHKVRPVIDTYRGLFRKNWRPEQFLAIDESIIPYKGKFCPCRIYMPEKPVKFGIKVYKLCNKLGITLDFWPYGGKDSKFPGEPFWMEQFNCGEKIVMNFVHSNFLSPGSVITGDRHFSSPTLAAILPDTFGVYYNGTCMQNRLYFPGFKLNNYNPSQTERGYYTFAYNDKYKVICSSWLDRDPVNFVSSAYGALPSYVVRGYKPQDRQYQQHKFPAPEMAVQYNQQMGNVDKSNYYAHLEHYSLSATMQCKKWWKRVNTGLYDMARTSAMVAWTEVTEKRNHGLFIDNLIHQYVNNRLDEGYSWKEMRTGCPAPEKGITRIAAAVRKNIIDKLVAGKKIRPQMLKDA